jgi:uncharacterized membrane protein YgdD (TMEM256/DUF423 family)
MGRFWILIGALSGGLSVITGAFGAHALRDRLTMRDMEVYQTGCHYQIVHALALVAFGIWVNQLGQVAQSGSLPSNISTALSITGWGFTIGTILFSGSLYALALSDVRILGAITPFGGVAFIVAWFSLAYAAWKTTS